MRSILAAVLALATFSAMPDKAEAGYRHYVVVAPVGVIGAAQLGSAFGHSRYGTYYPYYYSAPAYGYFRGPTTYYSRPAYFYGAPAYRTRRTVHRVRYQCHCHRR